MLGAVPGPGVGGGLAPSLKNYLKMVALETGTLVGACCEVAGNPAGMINPPLPVFGKQPGVLLQCQYDYLGGRGDPQVVGKTPTDVVERKRSLPVVLAHPLWPEEVYPLLPCQSEEATVQLQQLVLRDRVHTLTRPLNLWFESTRRP